MKEGIKARREEKGRKEDGVKIVKEEGRIAKEGRKEDSMRKWERNTNGWCSLFVTTFKK